MSGLISAEDNIYKRQTTEALLKAVARYRTLSSSNRLEPRENNDSDGDTLYCVHAAVSLGFTGCPLLVLFYAFLEFGEQATLRDQDGRLPLHVAVGPDNSSLPNSQWKFKPREFWPIQLSLHFHPVSASLVDPNEVPGRYPLHTALHYNHIWVEGVKELAQYAPHVLRMRDPHTGLYPFLMASATTTRSSEHAVHDDADNFALNTTFELLRADPTVLEQLQASFAANLSAEENDADSRKDETRDRDHAAAEYAVTGAAAALWTLGVCGLFIALLSLNTYGSTDIIVS